VAVPLASGVGGQITELNYHYRLMRNALLELAVWLQAGEGRGPRCCGGQHSLAERIKDKKKAAVVPYFKHQASSFKDL
jgi:hypothetical protein